MKFARNLGATKSDAAGNIKKSLELINAQLYSVEERIAQQARAFDPAVEPYVSYAMREHGKRLRPALALLAGGATGDTTPVTSISRWFLN